LMDEDVDVDPHVGERNVEVGRQLGAARASDEPGDHGHSASVSWNEDPHVVLSHGVDVAPSNESVPESEPIPEISVNYEIPVRLLSDSPLDEIFTVVSGPPVSEAADALTSHGSEEHVQEVVCVTVLEDESVDVTHACRKTVHFESEPVAPVPTSSESRRSSLSKILNSYADMDANIDHDAACMDQYIPDSGLDESSFLPYDDVVSLSELDAVDAPGPNKRKILLSREIMSTSDPTESFPAQLTPGNLFKSPTRRASQIQHSDENLRLKRGESSAFDLSPVKYFSSKLQKLYAVQSSISKVIDDMSIPEIKMDEFKINMRLVAEERISVNDKRSSITVDDLFSKSKYCERFPQKILVLGDSGVGES